MELRLNSASVEVEVEAELGKKFLVKTFSQKKLCGQKNFGKEKFC